MALLPHLGVGLASRHGVPKLPAIIVIIAPLLLDLLGGVFLLLQFDRTRMVILSHSLVMAAIWTIVFGLIIFLIYRNWRSSVLIGLLIFSHWVIDFITWPMTAVFPDHTGVPVFLDMSLQIGLGLYKSLLGVIVCEAGGLLLGIYVYLKYQAIEKGKSLFIRK
jgi:membrane-bound metal-dependent hydrolase YbcI (DUF457 family)